MSLLTTVRVYFYKHFERFALFTVDVIYDRRHGRGKKLYALLLQGVSYLFSLGVQLRSLLYRSHIFKNQPLGCFVIVVGNLTVGGTGKTPVVEKVACTLSKRGRKVAILSRGYKSKAEPFYRVWWRLLTHVEPPPPKIVSDGKTLLLDSAAAGDEPYMLARNLPGVPVIVDKNRVKAGIFAIKQFGVDTLILDDGFQYMSLKGLMNILLIDKTNPFGNRQLLPRGILREPIKHLKRASYIFLTKSGGEPDPELEQLIEQHHRKVEILECTHQPQCLHEFNRAPYQAASQPLAFLKGKRVGALSAIASPESFEVILRQYGAQLIYNRRFLDHHRFSNDELEHFFHQVQEAQLDMVITTEKDAVRILEAFIPPVPFYYLRVEIAFLKGTEQFESAVERICGMPQFAGCPRGDSNPHAITGNGF